MASAGGVDLQVEREEFRAGVVFPLSESRLSQATVDVDADCVVELRPAERVALVLLRDLPTPTEMLVRAHSAAEVALDLVAYRGDGAAALERAHDEHVGWMRESDGRAVLDVSLTTEVDVSVFSSPPPLSSVWTPALRFFRLSQVADELFGAYRNMFLALEAALSATYPGGPSGDRESLVWRLRQLPRHGLSATSYLQNDDGRDPVDQFVDEQYVARRCAMFHAKAERPVLLPGNLADRELVGDALEHLTRLVLDVVATVTTVRYPRSAMTLGGFEALFVAPRVGTLEMWLLSGRRFLRRRRRVPLDVAYVGKLDADGDEHGFVGECAAEAVDVIEGIDVVAPGSAFRPHERIQTPRIETAGAAQVRVHLAYALHNVGLPRSRFVY
jgi:hypothetical protein